MLISPELIVEAYIINGGLINMDDAKHVHQGVVDKGLGKMLSGKKVEKETPSQERKESIAHELMESKEYEKKEHKLCKHCGK